MVLAAGDYYTDATVEYVKAGTTVAISKGALLKHDTSNGGYVACSAGTAEFGPFAVCVEAMATGGTQVKVVTKGKVAVTCSGAPKPSVALVASSSTAGRVMAYAARTINVTTASTEWRRKAGRMVSDDEALGDGSLPVAASAGDVIIMELGGGA